MRWAVNIKHMGGKRGLVGKPKGYTALGGPRGRYGDNIKTDLREIEWE